MAAPFDHPLANLRVVQGAYCDDCKHHHAGKEVGFICIGCLCLNRPVPATLEDFEPREQRRELRMFDGITLEGRGLEPMDAFWLGALAGAALKRGIDPIAATESAIEGCRALGAPFSDYCQAVITQLDAVTVIALSDAPTTDDGRIAYGAQCLWWDSIDKVGTHKASGLPCCPKCGGMLFEKSSAAEFLDGAAKYEAEGHPGYVEFVKWARGHCYPSIQVARAAYDAEAPGVR